MSGLLSKGVDMNVCNENRETPLVLAVKAVNSTIPFLAAKPLKAVKALLVAGADIKTRDLGGRSALDWAATNAHADLLKLILKHLILKHGDSEWDSCDLQGRTALHRAAESDAHPADVEDAIKALVDGGADTEFLNEQVCTPLMHATRRFDCEEIMLALMRNGANPNARGLRNNTPLHEACMGRFGNLGTVVDLAAEVGGGRKRPQRRRNAARGNSRLERGRLFLRR